jgi:ketosteroid isomerase-like protein
MSKPVTLLSTVVVLCLVSSTSFAADAKATLAELDAAYDKTWNTLDANKLTEHYTDDVIIQPPTVQAATGTKAVLAFFEPLFKSLKSGEHKLEPLTAEQVSDKILVGASRWSANVTDAQGKTAKFGGTVAQTFEKVGNTWKLKVVSWNVLPDAK